MRRRYALALVLALAAAGAPPARASCTATTAGLAFGPYGPLDPGHRDSRGDIVVSCSGRPGSVISYVVRLSAGLRGSFRPRALRHGQNRLEYNLFIDPSRSVIWGDGTAGTEVVVNRLRVAADRAPATRTHPLFGRLFARQRVTAGAYRDLIQVTVETCTNAGECELARAALVIR